MTTLHHVCIAVTEYDRYIELFKSLGMHVQKTRDEAPNRQLWFEEGIQLSEVADAVNGNTVDHIALGVDDPRKTTEIMLAHGCSQMAKGEKWLELPNGVVVELMS